MTSLMLCSFRGTTRRSINLLLRRSTPRRITPFKPVYSSLKLPITSPISTVLLNSQPWTLNSDIGNGSYRLFHTKDSGVDYTSASTRIAKEAKHTDEDGVNDKKKTSSGSSPKWPETRRLFALARPEARLLGGAIALLLVSSAVSMSVPFSMGKILDIVTNPMAALPGNLTVTQFYSLLGGVFLAGALANTGRVTLMKLVGERIVARLRNNLFDTFLKQDVAFFDRTRSGELISRLSVDTSIVGKTLSNNISDGLRNTVMSIGGLSMMAYVSGKLTLCMVFIVPPMAVAAVYYGRYVRSLSKKTQSALGEVTKVAEERLSNIRTVFAFAREGDESKRYSNRVGEVFSLARKEAFASGIFFGMAGFTGNLTVLAVLALGGNMVSQGQISVGELASFLMYTAYVGSSTMGVTSFYSEMMKGLGAGSRLFELLDRVPAIDKDGGARLPIVHGEISFKDVHFTYPTRPGIQVLDGLTFTIKPGTSIAVAGTSGGGKSTIGSLILRFYDPTKGQVLIDGTDIRELDARWWRGYVGVVSQEPVLFAGTLADNIRYANPDATMAQVEEAARMANCDFIQRLPEQFDTFVGERGVSLSGGQKQRVAIARALLKNPRVLILDEATSALDAESEYLVQDALDRISRNRTVITIAHRASTLQRSDLVLCLDGGRAVEMGGYAELMAARGTFWRIMERQRTATTEEDKALMNEDKGEEEDEDEAEGKETFETDILGRSIEHISSNEKR